ncbi:unnamed protein product, partial [Ectocarpus fasciculatus]
GCWGSAGKHACVVRVDDGPEQRARVSVGQERCYSPEHDGCLGQTRLLGGHSDVRRRVWGTVQGTLRIDDGGSGRGGHVLRVPGVAASAEDERRKGRPRGQQLAVVGRRVENVPPVLGVLREPVQQPHGRFAGPGFGPAVGPSRQGRRRRSSARATGVVRCVSCRRQVPLSSNDDDDGSSSSSSSSTTTKPCSLQRNLLDRSRRRPKRSQRHRQHRQQQQQQQTRPRRSKHQQLRQQRRWRHGRHFPSLAADPPGRQGRRHHRGGQRSLLGATNPARGKRTR